MNDEAIRLAGASYKSTVHRFDSVKPAAISRHSHDFSSNSSASEGCNIRGGVSRHHSGCDLRNGSHRLLPLLRAASSRRTLRPGCNAAVGNRYWYLGPLKWFWANICFWRDTSYFLRPGGVLDRGVLYHCFGLNPRPYHIAQISILAASIPMLYYLTRSLSSSAFCRVSGRSCFLLPR